MAIKSMTIEIEEFGHDAMVENSRVEVLQILQSIINRIRENGVTNCDGMRLMDSNGIGIGYVKIDIEEDDEEETDEEDIDNEDCE